jgi:hypothetical protein
MTVPAPLLRAVRVLFMQATEQARISTEAASIACRDLVARVKAEQQKNLSQTLEDGSKRLEACSDQLGKWKTMHSRYALAH